MIFPLAACYLFLSLCLNKAHGHEFVGKPNGCTFEKGQTKCDVHPNDIIEFDVKCNSEIVNDYSLLKLPKGSLLTSISDSKIQIHIANVISKDETVQYKQKCTGDSDDTPREIVYKAGGDELKVHGVDFTGASIHFKITEADLNGDKTHTVEVGKWEVNKTIGLACPHKNTDEMKCFTTVFDDKDEEVTLASLLPGATFDDTKHPFFDKPIKNVESLVTLKELEPTDKTENEIKKFSFKCKCKVGKHTGTVNFTGEVHFPKKENPGPGPGPVNPTEPEGTDPNYDPSKNNSLTASVNVFGLLSVILCFYLSN